MKPTKDLPPHYRCIGKMDITKDVGLTVKMNLLGAVLFVLLGGLFMRLAYWLRPDEAAAALSISLSGTAGLFRVLAVVIGVMAAMILLHEGAHGLFFWIFTRTKPVFTFKIYYASASAPGWYIPRNAFLVTTLAPFVLLTALGVVMLMFLPARWLLPVLMLMTLNGGGAIGDLMVAAWLARQPASCLAFDEGHAVSLFVEDTQA